MSYAPKHSKGWHPRTSAMDILGQGQAATGRHRLSWYAHFTYTVVEKAVA